MMKLGGDGYRTKEGISIYNRFGIIAKEMALDGALSLVTCRSDGVLLGGIYFGEQR